MSERDAFLAARDLLHRHRDDYQAARSAFHWPRLERFNWATDYFDPFARGNRQTALRVVRPDGTERSRSFAEMADRSTRLARGLERLGARRGDRLVVMLPNTPELWEVMLAAMKLGVVIIPSTPQLTTRDLSDRFERGQARHIVTDQAGLEKLADLAPSGARVLIGGVAPGWSPYESTLDDGPVPTWGETRADDPLLLYFTSGTTAKPKLVLHTHASYPVGHLTTVFWLGLEPGDLHLNISSPGWAKHAWSSFFAPWTAGATIVMYDVARFEPAPLLETLVRVGVTSLCAPPTVWRMLVNQDLASYPVRLRELISAGEPLNPEVIERVRKAWGITIRDGYGQTETTALVGNPPGAPVKPGSMGRPLPGYRIELLDPLGQPADEGEISVMLGDDSPTGLMAGYLDQLDLLVAARAAGAYRTGDVATKDPDGYLTYVGRADDVFKSSDYRISPFELESVLIEHPAVSEAAVVESPDPIRLCVPKAFVVLRPGHEPSKALAGEILAFVRARVPAYKRVRRLAFAELPKTVSGKIRRVELRAAEQRRGADATAPDEFREEDFQQA
ncbi:MAG: AMP-binding protein [Gemmatimonadales bacterium]